LRDHCALIQKTEPCFGCGTDHSRSVNARRIATSTIDYWDVAAVDGFYSEILDRGALVTSQPTDKPGRLREFACAHRTAIASRVASSFGLSVSL
jgi:hypothetical protein